MPKKRRVPEASSSYFGQNAELLKIFATAGDSSLRECQTGAYWAAWAHFTSTDEPALLSLPTGAGKTALMMALAFGLKPRRCLIVTPSALLRDQIANNFRTLDDLKGRGVLPAAITPPKVHSNLNVLTSDQDWNQLKRFDVVVATPKTVSPIEKDISRPPTDLFDLVFFDEGHHEAAPSYRSILESFPRAKRLLLSGTPYRRDRRPLGAPLIYHYPIGRAVDAGIYEPVNYRPVETSGKTKPARDQALCDEAVRLWKQERRKQAALLLIRTDTIEHAQQLEQLYTKARLRIARVDYEQSLADNIDALDSLREGALDGIVCIGMMGEGIDVPNLKIAVLHAPPSHCH